MVDQTKACPKCTEVMQYRLGDYECPDCGHRESAASKKQEPGRGSGRPQQWDSGNDRSRSSSAPALPGFSPPRPASTRKPPAADFSPTGKQEKLILLGVFFVKGLIQVLGSAGAEGFMGALAFQVFDVGLISFILYVSFVPMKWVCATYSCFVGVFSLIGLFLGGALLTLTMPMLGGGEGVAVLGWLLGCAEAFVHLWLASLLYRDIQNIQVS